MKIELIFVYGASEKEKFEILNQSNNHRKQNLKLSNLISKIQTDKRTLTNRFTALYYLVKLYFSIFIPVNDGVTTY